MKKKILVCIAGLGGAIGTTVSVGLSVADSDETVRIGMVTESKMIKDLGLDFLSLDSILIDGWDIKTNNLYISAKAHMICPSGLIERSKQKLKNIIPRNPPKENLETIKDWMQRECKYIKEKCSKNNIKQVVIVNLCPTEPYSLQCDDKKVLWGNLSSLRLNLKGVTISRLYFRLAIEAGAHFINYTPNLAETYSAQTN